MPRRRVGDIIDGLGVTADIDDNDLVSDAVVLLECVQPDGKVTLCTAHGEAMNWIKKLGMLHAALSIEDSGYTQTESDDRE